MLDDSALDAFQDAGLNTLAISRVDVGIRNEICGPYFDLGDLVQRLKKRQFNIRLTFVALNGFNDSLDAIKETCRWARDKGVSQVTIRRMGVPSVENLRDKEKARQIYDFTVKNELSSDTWSETTRALFDEYQLLRAFDWGSVSWYVEGVECMIADCLTVPGLAGTIRYLIYCPDGHMRYAWEHENAIVF
jgi:hypothetical protein